MVQSESGPFTLRTETLGALPIVNHFLARMSLDAIIDAHLPANDARLRLDPAVVIGLLVRNLTIDHQPIYALVISGSSLIVGALCLVRVHEPDARFNATAAAH